MRKVESIECVRLNREGARQNLGFSSRPFVLCGLPVKRPASGCLLHERRNGQFVLQVTGHPSYGLPWGQDRLVPIFLATLAIRQKSPRITFESAAQMLDTFAMQQGGTQYRRLVGAFQRIFGATIFFGTDSQRERATVVHRARFNFMSEARIWYSRDPDQKLLPGDCQNVIVLSDEFYREILRSPHTDRSGSGKGAFIQSSRSRSIHVALVSLLHRAGEGARATLRRFRSDQPTGECGLCASSKVSREAGGLARSCSYDVAAVSRLD